MTGYVQSITEASTVDADGGVIITCIALLFNLRIYTISWSLYYITKCICLTWNALYSTCYYIPVPLEKREKQLKENTIWLHRNAVDSDARRYKVCLP